MNEYFERTYVGFIKEYNFKWMNLIALRRIAGFFQLFVILYCITGTQKIL